LSEPRLEQAAFGLLASLEGRGVSLQVDAAGEKIRFSPRSLVSAEEVESHKELKLHVIGILCAEPSETAVPPVLPSTEVQNTCKLKLFEADSSETAPVHEPSLLSTPDSRQNGQQGTERTAGGTVVDFPVHEESRIDKPDSHLKDSRTARTAISSTPIAGWSTQSARTIPHRPDA